MGRIFGFQILPPKITSEKPKYLTNMYQAHHIELACCLILKLKFMWNKSKYIQITKCFEVVAKLAFKRLLQVKVKVWIEVSIFVKFQLKLWRWSEVKATKWEMVWFLYATWTKQYLKKYSRKYLKKYLRSGFYMQHGQRNHFTMNLSFSSSSVDGQCTDSKVFNNPPLDKF